MRESTQNVTVKNGKRPFSFKKLMDKAAPWLAGIVVLGLMGTGGKYGLIACNSCMEEDRQERVGRHRAAYITVQYGGDGKAMHCWVTHRSDTITVTGMTSGYWIGDWTNYTRDAKSLGADPATCDVWNWDGKDDK